MAATDERQTNAVLETPTPLSDRLDTMVRGFDHLRDRPIASTLVATALVAIAAFAWWLGRPGPVAPVEARIPQVSNVPAQPEGPSTATVASVSSDIEEELDELLVHVAGAVHRPGIVTLDAGSRIGDAVAAAGGPTPDADVHRLNLAAPVTDGLQVRVPVEGEPVAATGIAPEVASQSDGQPARIDVNSASEAELEALPGIGPSLAAAIAEWRRVNGPFTTVDDLLRVPGIGPAKLDGLVDHVAL
ncbi:MAG: helix-hairpin-helix domain-containing protein [Acidimicrobiales bacterium]